MEKIVTEDGVPHPLYDAELLQSVSDGVLQWLNKQASPAGEYTLTAKFRHEGDGAGRIFLQWISIEPE